MNGSVFSSIHRYLQDVLRGMKSTWGSFVTAVPYLFRSGELRREVTEEYPDPISSRTADDLPARSRGLLENDIDRCTGCQECERICPTQAIRVESEIGPDPGKAWVSVFNIDFSRCVFCGLCVESCFPGSLRHSRKYEGAVHNLSEMVTQFGKGEVTETQRAKWAVLRQQAESEEVFS